VLLAASSQVTNVNGARGDPRPWRMSVTMSRDEDKWKMSNVEFVP
jgi:Mce-associated membrane protein